MGSDDRRQHPRADFPQVRLRFGRGPDLSEEVLYDLSVGGFYVTTDRTLPVGSEMEVHLGLIESGETYDLVGRVARIQLGADASADGMAVEFVELSTEAGERLRETVESFHERSAAALETGEGEGEGADVDDDPAIRQFQDRVLQLRRELMLSERSEPAVEADEPEAIHGEIEQVRADLEAERQETRELAAQVERLRAELVEVQGLVAANDELEGRVRALTNEVLDAREGLMVARQQLAEVEISSELEEVVVEVEGEEAREELTLEPQPTVVVVDSTDSSPPAEAEEVPATASATEDPKEASGFAWKTEAEASTTSETVAEPRPEAPSDDQQDTTESPAPAEPEITLGPEVVTTPEDFAERLENGARLRTTGRYKRLEPVSRNDIQVSDWLGEADDLESIRALAQGRMPEANLQRVLYLFFERGLVRIVE